MTISYIRLAKTLLNRNNNRDPFCNIKEKYTDEYKLWLSYPLNTVPTDESYQFD